MDRIVDEIKASFKQGSTLVKLIYINLAVFVAVKLLYVFYFLFSTEISEFIGKADYFKQTILTYLMMPADLTKLLGRPWTIISYNFLHFEFLHILGNLLWLFWFGRIFIKYLNEKQLLTTYFLGGISGGVLYALSYNLFPGLSMYLEHAEMLGASASVTAVVMASAFYAPNYEIQLPFIGPVKIKYIALVYLVLDVIQVAGPNSGGHIAHLGGAIYGYFFAMQLRKGKDIGSGFSKFADVLAVIFKRKPKMRVTHKNQARKMSDTDYNKAKSDSQAEVDRILDKIARAGYDSLTKSEKETLFKMSNKS